MTLTISVVVPSVNRPADLSRCLRALNEQVERPQEVLVVARVNDAATAVVADEFGAKTVTVERPGLAYAMVEGARAAKGVIVAFTDDDAAPRKDWIKELHQAYCLNPGVIGVGGRDVIAGETEPLKPNTSNVVGEITWYGKVTGNHHTAGSNFSRVSHLKGVNCSFFRESILEANHLRYVVGSGAQTRGEFILSLAVQGIDQNLWYSGRAIVDHFPAARTDGDERYASPSKSFEAAFNEHIAIAVFRKRVRLQNFAYLLAIGYAHCPGIARLVVGRASAACVHATIRGAFRAELVSVGFIK